MPQAHVERVVGERPDPDRVELAPDPQVPDVLKPEGEGTGAAVGAAITATGTSTRANE